MASYIIAIALFCQTQANGSGIIGWTQRDCQMRMSDCIITASLRTCTLQEIARWKERK